MPYTITTYTRQQAKRLGVTVKPSSRKGKKIAVFKNGKKVADVGAVGYCDFPCWKSRERSGEAPKGTADARRRAYKARHATDRKQRGTPGWYADKLLW
jgi:hypothetical protein